MKRAEEPLKKQLASIRDRIDARLAELAPAGPPSENFNRAIRYSLLAPGKRLRPMITVLTATSLGADESAALDPACAIEMIHTASLIIDDLPAMDDAEFRRGNPSNHMMFGEDKAILAGFALVNQAFDVIARADGIDSETRVALVKTAAQAIGLNGIIAGQNRDLHAEDTAQDAASIEKTYGLKTGALFVAAAEAGARVAGLRGTNLIPVRAFGQFFGLAYQSRDDLIDCHGTLGQAGKDVGVDHDKATLIRLLGETSAFEVGRGHVNSAIDALQPFGLAAQPLVQMSEMIFDPEVVTVN
jgi:geranylgeranyl diphosphate synthase type II